jgi:hypothetical protein
MSYKSQYHNDIDLDDMNRVYPNQNEIVDFSSETEAQRDIRKSNIILDEMTKDLGKRSIFSRANEDVTITHENISSAKARETYTILSSKDLAKSIPQNVTTQSIVPLPPGLVEWRWRFFKIGERKMVELSHYDGNKRLYTDYNGNKIEYEISDEWDKYIVKTLYAYARN